MAAIAACVIGTITAPAAGAATYTVQACVDAAHASTTGWYATNVGAFTYYGNGCSSGGSLEVAFLSDSTHADGDRASYSFVAPAATTITRLSGERSKDAGPDQVSGNPRSLLQADGVTVDECLRAAGCFGVPMTPVAFDFAGAHGIAISALCTGSAGCPAGNTSYRLRNIRLQLSDEFDPVIGLAPAGALTSSQNTDRVRNLTYAASDQGGGVFRQRLLIDGAAVVDSVPNSNNGKCQMPFADPVPCRTSATNSSIDFDTATVADGTHTVKLEVRDATDVNSVTTAPWTILVDNAPPSVGSVQVSGTPREGDTLTCTATAAGQSPSIAYAWMRANPDGSAMAAIAGATSASYGATSADVGKKLICRATATDHGGSTSRDSVITEGAFADGAVVAQYCAGRPSGASDECGDNDGDSVINRLDGDDDNDGVADVNDPAPFDARVPGTTPPTPVVPTPGQDGADGTNGSAGPAGSTGPSGNGATSTNAVTTFIATDLNTVMGLRNPITAALSNGTPASVDALLAVRFVKASGSSTRSGSTVVAAFGQRLGVRGTLQTAGLRPIGGARVYLIQKPVGADDSAWRVAKDAVTATDGSFELPVDAGGRSRDLRVVYFPQGGSNVNRGSNALTLHVRQDATFSVSSRRLHNGGRLVFKGRVLGVIPRSGVDVRVQVQLNRSWYTFTKLRTSASKGGRFRATHRFTKTTRATTYRFRILVLPKSRATYVSGFSRPIDVRVLP